MNLILFEPAEIERPLPRGDRRAQHILTVLRRGVGERFDVGLVDGPRGKATLVAQDEAALTLAFAFGEPPAPLPPLTLIVGLPRPQTARDILRDATTLGATALHFVRTERGDPGYAQSTLWSTGEWRRHALAGAEQAFDTRLPVVTSGRTLGEAVEALPAATARVALDIYEATGPLGETDVPRDGHPVLALGAERGWSDAERALLRARGFRIAHLGPRVLRLETACIAALSIVRSSAGLM